MKADTRTEGEVRGALQKLTEAYSKRDLKSVLECFASDADVVLYGTGADEKRIGLDQIRTQVERDWAQTETAAMSFASVSVSTAGTVAWIAADGAFNFRLEGEDMALPVRTSLVLEKREERWFVVHAHFSAPLPAQKEGESF